MASDSANFAQRMKATWEDGRGPAERENATIRAQTSGATRIWAVAIEDYRNQPGDIEASLWQWPDGSHYIVFDDGSGIKAPRPRGKPRRA